MSSETSPIVFCHGLFGWGERQLGGYPYFVCARRLERKEPDACPPFLFPSTGPISSIHDQACELFYQLKGGTINFGKDHSERFCHARYSRDYSGCGMYPEWSAERPLDFVAHSMGALVVRKLQYLLETGFFSREDGVDYGTSSRWIRSVTSVAGVHNGSTLTWILGADEDTGIARNDATALRLLTRLITRYAALQQRFSSLTEWYDLRLDQWGIERNGDLSGSLTRILEDPAFYASKDWALYDLTPNALEEFNAETREYADTWYYSYVTRSTVPLFFNLEFPVPYWTHFFLIPFAIKMAFFRPKSARWKKIITAKWHANDGMCPSWSQDIPKLGRDSSSIFPSQKNKSRNKRTPESLGSLESGVWHLVRRFRKVDHGEFAMIPHILRLGYGKRLYKKIVETILHVRKAR